MIESKIDGGPVRKHRSRNAVEDAGRRNINMTRFDLRKPAGLAVVSIKDRDIERKITEQRTNEGGKSRLAAPVPINRADLVPRRRKRVSAALSRMR